MYDYLIGYSMEDMSPEPGAGHRVGDLRGRADLDLHIRDGVTWSDGEPLTAEDVAYTYNRILDGGPEAATWGSYLTDVTSVDGAGRQTVVLTLKKPNAVAAAAADPDRARARLEGRHRGGGRRPTPTSPRTASRWSAPGRSGCVEGTAGGSTYRFEANPDYWGGAPHIDEVVFRVYKSEDPMVQALIKGEVDFVEDITALQVEALEGEDGITAQNGDSPGFDEIAFNTGADRHRDRRADRRRQPGAAGPGVPARARLRASTATQIIETVYQGAGAAGRTRSSRRRTRTTTGRRRRTDAFTYDPDKAGRAARRGRLHDGRRRLPHDAGRRADRHAPAVRARSDSPTSLDDGVLPGVAGRPRHRLRGRDLRVAASSPTSSSRATSTSSSGAGTSSPTRTRCSAT